MATYVNDLRLKEIATGDESGTWGTSTNTNLELIAEAFSFGTEAITTNADTHTTTIADGSTDPGRSIYLKYTGTLDSACTITIGPNTVSKLWFIENGTSGSQNIIISQGSGANVTIPPGDTKAIYSDGAGSGAAMVDAFASLNVVDLKVEDDLTVTDDLIVNGDIDLEGSIDVNGTANLDVVDIDGAVDMASTLAVGGAVTANAGVVIDNITIDGTEIDLSSGDLTLDSAGDIILDADGADILLKDAGTTFGELTNSSTDFVIKSTTSDKDIIFKGNDGGSAITALTLDMSAAGAATFNKGATFGGDITISEGTPAIIFTDTDNNYDASIAGLSGSLVLTADANAEFGTETIQFHTGGSQRATIDASGNLGLGTTSPTDTLEIAAANSQLRLTDTDDSKFLQFSYSGGNLIARNNSTSTEVNQFTLTEDGKFGVGTISPSVPLHTVGKIRAQKSGQTSAYVQLSANDVTSNYAADIFVDDTGLTFKHNSNSRGFVFDQNGTVRMTINSSGKLGLGTSSPTGLLEISAGDGSGNLNIVSTTNSSGSGNKIAFFGANRSDTDEEMAFIKPLLTSNNGGSGNVQTGSLTFGTSGSTRMTIDASGDTTFTGKINGIGILSNATNFSQSLLISQDAGTGTLSSASNNTGFGFQALDDLTSGTSNTAVGTNAMLVNTTGANNTALGNATLASNTTANANVAIGHNALTSNTTGSQNVCMGTFALDANTTASNNTAVGHAALGANTTGHSNAAFGHNTLQAATTANYNTAIGRLALKEVTTGGFNTAVGSLSGDAITTGSDNTFVGYQSGSATTTASHNTAVGHDAMVSNTTGDFNTALGSLALDANTTADYNVAIGYNSLSSNTTGAANTAVGFGSLQNNTTAANNVAIGGAAMQVNTTGSQNVAVGQTALDANTTADNNTAVGYAAMTANTTGDLNTAIGGLALTSNTVGDRAVAVGYNALQAQNPSTNTDTYNVAVGINAQFATTTGIQNTAVGGLALSANTTASNNTAVGYNALGAVTTGANNVALGTFALDATTTQDQNVAIGHTALTACTSANNVAVGDRALNVLTTGTENTAVGGIAGLSQTTGTKNTFLGYQAGVFLTTGDNNVFVGHTAGGVGTVTGDNNTSLGSGAGKNLSSGSNNLLLGKDAGVSGSPGGQIDTESNEIVLGDENISAANIQVSFTVASDKRDKTDVEPVKMGLDFVNDLNPVTYKWDKRSLYVEKGQSFSDVVPDGTHKEDWLDVGFLAQDVEKLEAAYGYNIADKTNLTTHVSIDGEQYGLTYEKFVPILVKSVQELSAQVEELKAEINILKGA